MKNNRIFTQMDVDAHTPVQALWGGGGRMRHRKTIKILQFSPKHMSPDKRKRSNPCTQANFPGCGPICSFCFLFSYTLGLLRYTFKIHRISVGNCREKQKEVPPEDSIELL